MRQHLEEEQQIREMIRKILSESREEKQILKEENLYKTFIAPFADVVNAVKLSGLDILNVMKMQFDVMFTLSPSKQKAAMEAYDSRKAEIQRGWDEIEKNNNEALAGGDAQMLAFLLNPTTAVGAKFGIGAAKSVPNTINYLDDAGWRIPLAGMIPGVQYDSMKDTKGASGGTRSQYRQTTSKDKGGLISTIKNTAKEMADLFFITHYAPPGPLLAEDKKTKNPGPPWGIEGYEEKAEDMKPMSKDQFEKELESYFEETGLFAAMKQKADDWIQMKKDHIEAIMEAGEQQLAVVTALGSALTLEDFSVALEDAQTLGLQVEGTETVEADIEEAAQKLVGEQEFIDEIKAQKKLKPEDEIPEEELLESARSIVFMEAKKDIQLQLEEGLPQLQESIIEQIMHDVPKKDQETFKSVSGSPAGREYLKMVEDAVKQVEDYKIEAL